jgi:hypothetical protein
VAEYIERDKILGYMDLVVIHARGVAGNDSILKKVTDIVENMRDLVAEAPSADVVPVVHGRWEERDESHYDAYWHHKCTNCNADAPFDYKMREDWDEGMDGEWYPLGIIDDGINEHLTPYCPNCGAHMKDGE